METVAIFEDEIKVEFDERGVRAADESAVHEFGEELTGGGGGTVGRKIGEGEV